MTVATYRPDHAHAFSAYREAVHAYRKRRHVHRPRVDGASDHAFWSYSEAQGARVVSSGGAESVCILRTYTYPAYGAAVYRYRSAAVLGDDGEGSMYYTWNTEASPLDLKVGTGTV